VADHEQEMVAYALERLEEIPGLKVFGPPANKKGGVAAFTLEGIHPHDIAQVVDRYGVAIRAGHHCAQPLHEKFGITATARASFYIYSIKEDVDKLIDGIYEVKKIFG
jgi:cysteine desulfurase/selenocysteine lyase